MGDLPEKGCEEGWGGGFNFSLLHLMRTMALGLS